ncbi:hypothetical protein [Flagellimonas onchidii]|uniref:hypothetical protein n=1 Tax=Flagellimonas onchidii TaxID=2562684 RepID=UPI0010A6176E|nr:hypothetical protein [Allomuricauda onchidii]
MKFNTIIILLLIFISSCENEDDFNPSTLAENFNLRIENDNPPADMISEIAVIAEFPVNFNTEDDSKVDFLIFKEEREEMSSDIVLTEDNGNNVKQAELLVSYNRDTPIIVEGTISINGTVISKEVEITFSKAYPDSINVKSSSLTITPNSFEEIEITTELLRNIGNVSLNTIAETRVVDTNGTTRGIFNNYQNRTDSNGKIINKLTMGNDTYEGMLFVISSVINEENEIKTDTLTIYSQN